ncbi:MFS transporter [Mycobacterium pseudoshottsii]|uniref:MFS transporter n=1 Tax=Mycobacterium pseudoshottsii TaxID=265949 RepID=UPI00076EB74C|nr:MULTISPECIES: nitrate/nitrite transporter [Mycobacterium ulcerans group]MBC9861176.1 Nitrate/nitrite transporter NarK/U [Mycobacterium pseudoshottsii]RFZ56709.1 Nitrate/nitrite transporter NarK [Mycobacterium marinum]BBA86348.1 MFS transporter [Mycobacterium pseudoshottsii JCM 15466]GAQ32555.1 nitrate/nitrite transporter [Mycobacterium pseudoshottsii JCM 15466]
MTITPVRQHTAPCEQHVGRHWIHDWRPEDPEFWDTIGRPIARRNLVFSIFAEHIGFSVWMLWSIVVVQMMAVGAPGHPSHPAASGWALSPSQALCLVAVPSGVGALLRLPYTFAIPVFGGRNWTTISASLLVIPCLLLSWAVSHPGIPFVLLTLIAATAGVGGGNFASSMANISFFYPEKDKGWALGLNAAGGNIGVAVVQKIIPPIVVAGGGMALARAGLFYVPLAVVAAVCAFAFMNNLAEAKADVKPVWQSLRHADTWILALLYIGTFGSFIGYSAAFPTLLKTVFDRGDIALGWAFLGAGIGSVIRPLGGRLGDRVGGARVTAVSFLMLAIGAAAALWSVQNVNSPLFFASFMFLFVATGIGNGSTYRMISRIFKVKGELAGGDPDTMVQMRRQAAGALGVISAVGAFGGFLVPLAYAWSKAQFGNIEPALRFYVVFFLALLFVTWHCYLRSKTPMAQLGV